MQSLPGPSWVRRLRKVVLGTAREDVRLRDALTLRHAAWLVVASSLGLSVMGVYAIDVALGSGEGLHPIAVRQLVFLVLGMALAGAVVAPNHRLLEALAWPGYLVLLGLLVFLLIPVVPSWLVTPRNGTRGWINLGVSDFQPSEVMKVAFVLVVARYMRFRSGHRTLPGLIPPAIIAFVPVALIVLQPDLGTACLFIPALFGMVLAAGARLRHLTLIVLVAAMAAPAAYPLLRPHQKTRIVALIKQVQGDRSADDSSNFQSVTAQRLVGSGGATGVADDHARALVRFNQLPERHNDMVYAVVTARFGLVGALAVLALYLAWFVGAVLTAGACRHPFGRLVVIGVTGFIAAQMVINIGMTIGLLPIIGITLPYVSYGGSSMLTVWLMTGLIFNVAVRRPSPPLRPSFEYASVDV